MVPGEGIEPSWVLRAGNSSHDYTDRPGVTDAIVWAEQWQGTRWSRERGSRTRNTSRRNSGTSGSSSRPTRTRCTILLRVPKGLRQGVGSAELILLGHLGVDGGRLDRGVPELLLDDLQVVPARPPDGRRADRRLGKRARKRARDCPEPAQIYPTPPKMKRKTPSANQRLTEGHEFASRFRRPTLYPS